MDPSHSTPDPHHPPLFTPFPPFPTPNNNFLSGHVPALNHPLYGGQSINQIPFNNHVFHPRPQPQPQPRPQAQQLPQPQPQRLPQPQQLSQRQQLSQPQPQAQQLPQPQPQPHPHQLSQPQPQPQQLSQPQPQVQQPQMAPSQAAPLQARSSSNHPSYAEMICTAITALNEPDGSSKMAIAKHLERSNPDMPPANGALLSHHLKSLKRSGVVAMVKKSYKLAASSPASVAIAAAGLETPRSEIPPTNTGPIDPMDVSASGSASQPLKRGRGRPPKPKPEAPQQQQQQQPINVQPDTVLSNGQPNGEQHMLTETNPTEEVKVPEKRGPGRPRKDGSAPIPRVATVAGIMKRRGRPAGRRAAGRQRKPISVSATASVFPYVASGSRSRGRPSRVDSGGVPTVAPAGGETMAAAPGMKRGPGRPPKIGGVMNRFITKPKRGVGRPAGRPRKNTTWPVTAATGTQAVAAYEELKRKLDVFKEKAEEILSVLKAGVASGYNQAVAEATQELEGLIPMLTVEPQAMEEVQPEVVAQGGEHEQERGGGGGEQVQTQTQIQTETETQTQPQTETETQTKAEAMQEALF